MIAPLKSDQQYFDCLNEDFLVCIFDYWVDITHTMNLLVLKAFSQESMSEKGIGAHTQFSSFKLTSHNLEDTTGCGIKTK